MILLQTQINMFIDSSTSKRKAPEATKRGVVITQGTKLKVQQDSTIFATQVSQEPFENVTIKRNLCPEGTAFLKYGEIDVVQNEIKRRKWNETFTTLPKDNIDEALVMEFYTNTYDPEGTYPPKVTVRGKIIKFDFYIVNSLLKTLVNLQPVPGTNNQLTLYYQWPKIPKDHTLIVAKLCMLGKGFQMSHGTPWRIWRESVTNLTKSQNVFSFCNLMPTTHTSNINFGKDELIYGI